VRTNASPPAIRWLLAKDVVAVLIRMLITVLRRKPHQWRFEHELRNNLARCIRRAVKRRSHVKAAERIGRRVVSLGDRHRVSADINDWIANLLVHGLSPAKIDLIKVNITMVRLANRARIYDGRHPDARRWRENARGKGQLASEVKCALWHGGAHHVASAVA
jgi:hypothetical protein